MADEEAPRRELIPAPDRTLAPARSLAERTLASLRAQAADVVATTRRLVVAADGSAMFATIGAAIAIAVDGDEIVIEPGHYAEHLTIDRSIRISGHGPRELIILSPSTANAPCVTITGGTPHLIGFTIDGTGFEVPDDCEDSGLVRATGGSPVLEALDLGAGLGVSFEGGRTAGAIRSCSIHDGRGIFVGLGAAPLIENNEIWANVSAGLEIRDAGTDPIVRANRIHDGLSIGIVVADGAAPRVENNEIWANLMGIMLVSSGTDPIVRANRIHDGAAGGIVVGLGATPLIEGNEIWANGWAEIEINDAGTDPIVRTNRIHDGVHVGIYVGLGAAPLIENNEIWANARSGIEIKDAGTDPIVRANRIYECKGGIYVYGGAEARIEDNEIWANEGAGLYVSGAGTSPVVVGNTLRDGPDDGIVVHDGASPRIRGNTIMGNGLLAIGVEDDAKPIVGQSMEGMSRGSTIARDVQTALVWTPAERELARAGYPQVARFLRLVAELEPSARDQIGHRIVLDDRFKLAARTVVAAAAAASPAFDIEKHVAQAIAERQSLATSSSALFRSALLVMGVALGIFSRLDEATWITVWSLGLGDPIVPFVAVWSPLSGEPAEFRSTLAVAAVADMKADMSRKMADIRKNS